MCNCNRATTLLRRLSSHTSQGIAAFFSIDKKNTELGRTPSNSNSQKQKTSIEGEERSQQNTLYINPVLLFAAILSSTALAFCVGAILRILVQSRSAAQFNGPSSPQAANLSFAKLIDPGAKQLSPPTVIPGKEVPHTTYTFQHFPVEGSRSNYDLHLDRSDEEHDLVYELDKNNEDSSECSSDDKEDNDDSLEGLHLPAGQHLLIDIKNVDPIFLNSEERLAEAMIQLVDESKITLLSYHCQ